MHYRLRVTYSLCFYYYSQQDISDPFISPPEVDTNLVKLYDDIRITVRREAEIITAVFPNPVIVMQVFLQRVFAQCVSK